MDLISLDHMVESERLRPWITESCLFKLLYYSYVWKEPSIH